MDRNQLKELLQYVVDTNKQAIFELVTAQKFQISETQLRSLINVMESTTKEGFFKIMAQSEK